MTSRLDRLFVLLETGSSPLTRKAAAQQLGEVQKLHPHELHNLLLRLHVYLHNSSWETRIAAGEAVTAIIKNVPQWQPRGSVIKSECSKFIYSETGRLKFTQFDICKVLENGTHLTASEGKEFEVEDDRRNTLSTATDSREVMAHQRQMLNKKLGLEIAEKIGLDVSGIFNCDDLVVVTDNEQQESNKCSGLELVQQQEFVSSPTTLGINPALSYREMNRAKRKARLLAKQKSMDMGSLQSSENSMDDDMDLPEPDRKRIRGEIIKEETENIFSYEDSGDWPFEYFCEQLCQDLFSPSWEVRHGAAIALREIIMLHGKGAGKSMDSPCMELESCHQAWLEDLSLRLLCVLALDRFGDFVSDQVVAPVRESCTQALGAILNLMCVEGVMGVSSVLLTLVKQKEWEARHGALLGFKYLLAVRKDLTLQLLPNVFESIFQCLRDPVDDVSAESAACLLPVASSLPSLNVMPRVVETLWGMLGTEVDDLAASSGMVMSLLAALLGQPHGQQNLSLQPMSELVPFLFPFLSHSSSSVRKSTVETLLTLTDANHPEPCAQWLPAIIQDTLRYVYQRALLEHVSGILQHLEKLWFNLVTNTPLEYLLTAACPYTCSWLMMAMQPSRVAFDPSCFIQPKERLVKCKTVNPTVDDGSGLKIEQSKLFIGGNESLCESPANRELHVIKTRCTVARLLGLLSCYIVQPVPYVVYTVDIDIPLDLYVNKIILPVLTSRSALQRTVMGLVISQWAEKQTVLNCPITLSSRLDECLNEAPYFDELSIAFTKLQQEAWDYVATLRHYQLQLWEPYVTRRILSFDQIKQLSGAISTDLFKNYKLKTKVLDMLESRRKGITQMAIQACNDQTALCTMTHASLAGAATLLNCLPEKLNPVVKPLMDSIKKQENEDLQKIGAHHLTRLLELCLNRNPSPVGKVIKNLCNFLCNDPDFTPRIAQIRTEIQEKCCDGTDQNSEQDNKYSGILTLLLQQKIAERTTLRRLNSSGRGPGRPPSLSSVDIPIDELIPGAEETQKQNETQRRGATFALKSIVSYFAGDLPQKLPCLWDSMVTQIHEKVKTDPLGADTNDEAAQSLVFNLQVLEITTPAVHLQLHPQLVSLVPHLCALLEHNYSAVRHLAGRCLGILAKVQTGPVMEAVVSRVVPLLDSCDSHIKRQGAVEAIASVIDQLTMNLIPYIVLLVVPVLGRISDQNTPVRIMATQCFATLVRLMPLEGSVPDPPSIGPELAQKKLQERYFLQQLFDPKKIEEYRLPIPISTELRSYQQSGVNWLSFLNKYKLHGILCDDMGLGKTLQSICILSGDHWSRKKSNEKNKNCENIDLPSLVICPPTLTGHWIYEVEKFVSREYLNPLHYTGPPTERCRLRGRVKHHNLVIASYDIVRNDIDFFCKMKWNYCILDEGHVIKNGKTKSSQAIKQLTANHRLILSGTPIQNNVLELWSLFDFLMPGYLGTEKQFTARYSRPILNSRDAKSSSKEQEAGALAMESLHHQVLPFLLRRMKEDVLEDLPPKITQDYYCDLSPLQEQLYEDFAKSKAHQSVQDTLAANDTTATIKQNTHVFQALQYLRKVCNHPKLVLTPQHPEFQRVANKLKQQSSSLIDIQHAAKLPALKQLLLDCGIGVPSESQGGNESVVNQHRALIFCQLKAMLDILEKDFFKIHMPSVTYLRLDGSIAAGMRHSVVARFNNDPSIDLLLLTTQVGGLGLNLTGADTVIFVEHDWNPMKDMQAMDRAHRIGQKKVVNVYRLITRATLEEKIMGLQKFKLITANTVINQDNSSLDSMGIDQLLDLFSLEEKKKGEAIKPKASDNPNDGEKKTPSVAVETLPELWDECQYEEEYNLDSFMQGLKK